jgi:chorismate mutase/chorismate mutase/prephenate dehydratase
MSELEAFRKEIDQIDEELTRLFEARMETVLKVGAYKKARNLPIFDASREQKVIEKNLARLKNKQFEKETAAFFQQMMDITKETQKKMLAE